MVAAHTDMLSNMSFGQKNLRDILLEVKEFTEKHQMWSQLVVAAMALKDYKDDCIDLERELDAVPLFDDWHNNAKEMGYKISKEISGVKSAYCETVKLAHELLEEQSSPEDRKTVYERFSGNPKVPGNRGICGMFSNALEILRNKIERYENSIHYVTGLHDRYALDLDVIETTNVSLNGMSIVMIDIDKFKKINDTKGHVVGDKVLRVVAEAVSKILRHEDKGRLYLYGGDEMIGLLKATREELEAIVFRIRTAVKTACEESPELKHCEGGPVSVTVSIGAAPLPLHDPKSFSDKNSRVEAAKAEADKALYEAKETRDAGVVAVVPYAYAKGKTIRSVETNNLDNEISAEPQQTISHKLDERKNRKPETGASGSGGDERGE